MNSGFIYNWWGTPTSSSELQSCSVRWFPQFWRKKLHNIGINLNVSIDLNINIDISISILASSSIMISTSYLVKCSSSGGNCYVVFSASTLTDHQKLHRSRKDFATMHCATKIHKTFSADCGSRRKPIATIAEMHLVNIFQVSAILLEVQQQHQQKLSTSQSTSSTSSK